MVRDLYLKGILLSPSPADASGISGTLQLLLTIGDGLLLFKEELVSADGLHLPLLEDLSCLSWRSFSKQVRSIDPIPD